MNTTILQKMHLLPRDLDLVVGVPRSGLLAANLLALAANLPLSDLDGYLQGRAYTSGVTKAGGMRPTYPGPRKILVLDDSINGGGAMREARARVAAAGLSDQVLFAAVYGNQEYNTVADLVLEVVPQPRMFEWNFMHHAFLQQACVDIDGVLCHDPAHAENDDGNAYLRFLVDARPLYRITHHIGTLVTSRLEKYRPQTEAWLERNGLSYSKLVMLNLPNAEERRRQNAHGTFKGEYYRDSDAIIFIESENRQAHRIAQLSGKPVLCLETHSIVAPTAWDEMVGKLHTDPSRSALVLIKTGIRTTLGDRRYEALKKRLSS